MAGTDTGPGSHRRRWLMPTLRYVLPALVTLAGIVVMALGSQADIEGGAAIVSAGVAIYLANWLVRLGARGEHERAAEDAAREHLSRHGRWPS